ncbi:MAG: hypothetical protein JW888_17655 [Pirellulales bacterium]|nr:hypothetical protein [Pirellulales bacterium]
MSPANHPPGRQHPFDPVAPPALASMAEGKDQEEEKTAILALAESALDPESLGVVLSSTIIGSRSQAALINGKSYRLGSTIRLDHDRRPIEFQLVEIRSDGIVLQRGEKSYEVCLPDPAKSDRLEMTLLQDD